MPRLLPSRDFRARRVVLTRNDFGYAPGPEPPPSDRIRRATWSSIVTLPDDVAVRTSNHHGTTLQQLDELHGAWVRAVGDDQDCMFPVMLDAQDDFQASTYLALTGYYRLSVAALRSAIELVAIGAWAHLSGRLQEFQRWRRQEITLSFGRACDGLHGSAVALGNHLRATVNDGLFEQSTPTSEGGFARRIYSGISDFAHSRPGSTDGDLRRSNGPIYVRTVFEHVAWMQFETFALCFVLLLLARPNLELDPGILELFDDQQRVQSHVTGAAFQFLTDGRPSRNLSAGS